MYIYQFRIDAKIDTDRAPTGELRDPRSAGDAKVNSVHIVIDNTTIRKHS